MIDRRALLGGALGLGLLATARASDAQGWGDPPSPATGDPDAPFWPPRESYRLWPKGPPGAPRTLPAANWTMNGPRGARELWIRGVPYPELHVYRAPRADGSALLSLPGGGYGFLSVQNEGIDVAQHFNAWGTTVFVLTYRLPGEGWADRHLVPLQDTQRAMRTIRARAADFRIDPKRLGVLGFSAGGHLAADLAVAYDERTYAPVDEIDRQSAKPAWAGLVYPVTSLQPRPGQRGGSSGMLFGESGGAPALVAARSPVLHVNAQTPRSFLVHALDDPVVPLENVTEWIAASRAAKVPVEAHIFSEGGHGFGLHLPKENPGSRWPELLNIWMRRNGG